MLLERRLNFYGQLTWHEVEYLLWREGNTDGSYIVRVQRRCCVLFVFLPKLCVIVYLFLHGGRGGVEGGARLSSLLRNIFWAANADILSVGCPLGGMYFNANPIRTLIYVTPRFLSRSNTLRTWRC